MGSVKASIREESHSGPDYFDAVAVELANAYLRSQAVSFKNGPEEYYVASRELTAIAARYERALTVRLLIAESGETLQGLRRTCAVDVAEADLRLRSITCTGENYVAQLDEVNRSRDRYQVIVDAIADGYR